MNIFLKSFVTCSYVTLDFKAKGIKKVFYPPYDVFVFALASFKYKDECSVRMDWYIDSKQICQYNIDLPKKKDDDYRYVFSQRLIYYTC